MSLLESIQEQQRLWDEDPPIKFSDDVSVTSVEDLVLNHIVYPCKPTFYLDGEGQCDKHLRSLRDVYQLAKYYCDADLLSVLKVVIKDSKFYHCPNIQRCMVRPNTEKLYHLGTNNYQIYKKGTMDLVFDLNSNLDNILAL